MIGERCGRLTVAEIVPAPLDKIYRTAWLRCDCDCDCGGEVVTQPHKIARGHIKSCGCLAPRHGMSNTKEHTAWANMQRRCNNPEDPAFEYVGGMGIKVCDRWNRAAGGSFANFLEDIGPIPSPGCFLDRIDRKGDYTPENCVWTQAENRNRAKLHTFRGESRTMKEWAAHWNVSRTAARHRILNPECEWRS